MSGTIALMVAWLHFNGSFTKPQPVGLVFMQPEKQRLAGYVCPRHGVLYDFCDGWSMGTVIIRSGDPRGLSRRVCTACLLDAVETPGECLPKIEAVP